MMIDYRCFKKAVTSTSDGIKFRLQIDSSNGNPIKVSPLWSLD